MKDIDPLELAQFEDRLTRERERRFLDSLIEANREFVKESDQLRLRMLSEVQRMLSETNPTLRHESAAWVAAHASDVAERAAIVMKMRVHFYETDVEALRVTIGR